MRSASLVLSRTLASPQARWIVALGVVPLATALAGAVRIPLPGTMVPFTLQTFVVLLFAALLGARAGAAGQAVYLGLGGLGLPLFTWGGAGWTYLRGETGGYLVGFVVAAAVVGLLVGDVRRAGLGRLAAAMAVGTTLILALGTLHLATLHGLTWPQALGAGVVPFLPGAIIKTAAAATLARAFAGRPGSRATEG